MASAPLHLARSFTLEPSHTSYRWSPSSSDNFLGGFFISSSSLPDVRLCTAKFTPILDVGYTTLAELVTTQHRGYVYRSRPEWCSCGRKWGLSANARQSIVRMYRKTTVIAHDMKIKLDHLSLLLNIHYSDFNSIFEQILQRGVQGTS